MFLILNSNLYLKNCWSKKTKSRKKGTVPSIFPES